MTNDQKLDEIKWSAQSADGQVMLSMPWEIFVLGVAILSITNLFLALLAPDPDAQQVVFIVDGILMVIFLVDLIRRLGVATDNRGYFIEGRGWLDALSIIPLLRIARVLRILRVYRVVGRMGGPAEALRAFFANKATGGLLLVFLIAIMVLEFGSLAMLRVESADPAANIQTAEDAIWYIIVTMSTVGYGDFYPVTTAGRVVGSLIIVVGVGVFGTLTGYLANAFLAPSGSGNASGDS